MSLILSGTDGLSDIDGSAATPAIRGTDANTGIFFGTDIIGFSEGGVEAARINANSQFVAAAGTAALPVITTTGDLNTGIFFPAADTIAFAEGGAEIARFDSSGNLGIGATTNNVYDAVAAGRPLVVQKSDTNTTLNGSTASITITNGDTTTNNSAQLNFAAITGANASQFSAATISTVFGARTNGQYPTGQLAFSTSTSLNSAPSEKMRIDSSGNLLVGATSGPVISGVPSNSCIVSSAASGNWQLGVQNTSASGGPRGVAVNYSAQTPNDTQAEPFFFSDSTAYRFSLRSNGGITNYSANNVNLSDRREKTNFAPAKSYLDVICAIPVQTFNYIDQNLETDDGLTLGVVAQDVQAVAPELVSESDWSSERDGSKMRLSIYQTDLQYALMKCIQEQQALITALTARITALETQNADNPPQGETP
jgi:hypothetical protein